MRQKRQTGLTARSGSSYGTGKPNGENAIAHEPARIGSFELLALSAASALQSEHDCHRAPQRHLRLLLEPKFPSPQYRQCRLVLPDRTIAEYAKKS
jgi:hypothetical protein